MAESRPVIFFIAVYISLPLVLLIAEADPVSETGYGKKNLVSSHSSSGSKVVLILLIEVVTVYMGLSTIHVWRTGLQYFILRLLGGGGS